MEREREMDCGIACSQSTKACILHAESLCGEVAFRRGVRENVIAVQHS